MQPGSPTVFEPTLRGHRADTAPPCERGEGLQGYEVREDKPASAERRPVRHAIARGVADQGTGRGVRASMRGRSLQMAQPRHRADAEGVGE